MSEKSEMSGWEVAVEELRERMIFLLQDVSPNRGRYAYLEEITGISAARWQNLFLRRLYPSMDMVYAAMHLKHMHRDWLVHGWDHTLSASESALKQPEEDRWKKFIEFRQKDVEKAHRDELRKQGFEVNGR
jgi:hypothetical protein